MLYQKNKFSNLATQLDNVRIIGIGESTHGSHEFFDNKSSIFKELVISHKYNMLLFEDNQETIMPINNYIQQNKGSLSNLMQKLYPVWQTQEVYELIEWMRQEANNNRKICILGFDVDQSTEDMKFREQKMANNIINKLSTNRSKALVWAHNFHISKTPISGYKTMGFYLKDYFQNRYYAIAQLFGTGTFNATLLRKNNQNTTDRTLSSISINRINNYLLEYQLNTLNKTKPFIATTKHLNDYLGKGQNSMIRSIGWGVILENIDDYIDEFEIPKAYDSICYFPESHCSRIISKQQ